MLPNNTSPKEGLQPAKVLSLFFEDFNLPEVRDTLWQLVEVAITTNNAEFDEPEDRAELLCLYSRLGELIEAACIINEGSNQAPQQA